MSPIRASEKARYPADWAEISRRVRFDRAGGRCECTGECGRDTHEGRCPNLHGQPAYGTGSRVVLTTAHLDHTPENCEDENLRAMCQGCHLHYDKEHHAQTRATTRDIREMAMEISKHHRLDPMTTTDRCTCGHKHELGKLTTEHIAQQLVNQGWRKR